MGTLVGIIAVGAVVSAVVGAVVGMKSYVNANVS